MRARSDRAGPRVPGRRYRRGVFLILVVAAILRLYDIGGKSLWLDEIMTVQKASLTFSGMMEQIASHDAHPPLFQIIEWLWLRLGRSDGFSRLPAAFAGIAGVALACAVARRLFGRRSMILAGALMAVSYFQVYYSQEARLYSLVMVLVLGLTWLLIRILEHRGRAGWGWWLSYAAVAAACLYTYLLTFLAIGALGVAYLVLSRRRQWTRFVVANILAAALFVPWLPVTTRITSRLRADLAAHGGSLPRPGFRSISGGVAEWVLGPRPWTQIPPLRAALGVSLLVLVGAGLAARKSRRGPRFIAIGFLLPLVAYVLMPMPRVHIYDPKHLAFLQPLLLIGLSGMRFGLRERRGTPLIAVAGCAALVVLLNAWSLRHYYDRNFQKERWPEVAEYVVPGIEKHDGIVFNPPYIGFAFEYYAGSDAARSLVRECATRVAESRPVRRVWLVQCRSPVAYPSPVIEEKIVKGGWSPEPATARAFAGHLGQITVVRFGRRVDSDGFP